MDKPEKPHPASELIHDILADVAEPALSAVGTKSPRSSHAEPDVADDSNQTAPVSPTPTQPVVTFVFHPHWVDAMAVRAAVKAMNPRTAVIGGEHRMNDVVREQAVALGIDVAEHGHQEVRADVVAYFVDHSDDMDARPDIPVGTTLLVCSHVDRHAVGWHLG